VHLDHVQQLDPILGMNGVTSLAYTQDMEGKQIEAARVTPATRFSVFVNRLVRRCTSLMKSSDQNLVIHVRNNRRVGCRMFKLSIAGTNGRNGHDQNVRKNATKSWKVTDVKAKTFSRKPICNQASKHLRLSNFVTSFYFHICSVPMFLIIQRGDCVLFGGLRKQPRPKRRITSPQLNDYSH
jgi:hypothetical protein